MTREYILENLEVMCPIIFIDNSGLRDHVMSTLQDSLLIPKPKFKVGDKVQVVNRGELWQFLIYERYFNPDKGIWIYEDDHYSPFDEDELELVERKEK